MSFTTELQDLKTKIEALIAAGGIIEPALISQLAEINQALDTGGGGGGTPQATIEAAITATTKRYVYDPTFTIASRPADTTDYTAGDAFGTGGNAAVFEDVGATDSVLIAVDLYSLSPVAGNLGLNLSHNALPASTDNSPVTATTNSQFSGTFLSSNWTQISGYYHNRIECVAGFIFYPPSHLIYGQLTALETFTPVASQLVNVALTFIDA